MGTRNVYFEATTPRKSLKEQQDGVFMKAKVNEPIELRNHTQVSAVPRIKSLTTPTLCNVGK
jgi:hypothetical protein